MPGQEFNAGKGKGNLRSRGQGEEGLLAFFVHLAQPTFYTIRTRGCVVAQPLSWAELSHISHELRKCPTYLAHSSVLWGHLLNWVFLFVNGSSLYDADKRLKPTDSFYPKRYLLIQEQGCVYVWITITCLNILFKVVLSTWMHNTCVCTEIFHVIIYLMYSILEPCW